MESPNDISPPSKEISEFSSLEEFSTLEELPIVVSEEKMADSQEMKISVPEGPGIREEETPRFSDPEDEKTEDSFEIPQVEFSDSQDSDHPAIQSMPLDYSASDSSIGITREDFPEFTSDESDQLMSVSDVSIPMGTGTSSEPTTDTESGDRTMQTIVERPSQPAVSEAIAEISADFASGNLNVSLSQYPIEGDSVLESTADKTDSGLETPPHEHLEAIPDAEEENAPERKSSEGSEISEHPLDDFVNVEEQVDSSSDEISQHPLGGAEDKTLTDSSVELDAVHQPKDEEEMLPAPQEDDTESMVVQSEMAPIEETKTEKDIDFDDETIAFQQSKAGVSIISDSVAVMGKQPIYASTPYVVHEVDSIAKIDLPPEPKDTDTETETLPDDHTIRVIGAKEDITAEADVPPTEELVVPAHVAENDSSVLSTDSLATSDEVTKGSEDAQEVQLPLDLSTLQPEFKTSRQEADQEPEQSSTQSIEMRPASFYIDYPSDLQSGQSSTLNETDEVAAEKDSENTHVWNGIEDDNIRKRIEESTKSSEETASSEGERRSARKANVNSFAGQDSLSRRVALLLGEDVGAGDEEKPVRESDVFQEPDMEPATETLIQDIETFIETGEAVGGIILPPESREPIKHSLSTSTHEFIPPPAEFDEPIRHRTVSPPSSETDSSGDSSDSISRQVAELLDRTDSLARLAGTDYHFKRPYSPTGSDSTNVSDSISQKVDYLLGMAQSQTRDVAGGLEFDPQDRHAASSSTLSEASTSSSVRAIIERVMAKHGRPELDFFNGSSFIDTSSAYQLPDRSSPAGSADFEDDLAAQITDAYSLTESKQHADVEVEEIIRRQAVPGEVQGEDEERDGDTDREGSPDSLTECKTPSTPSHRKPDWLRSLSSPTVSAGFSLHDDVPQDSARSVHSAHEIQAQPEELPRRISSNISGASAQSSDSLHRRVQLLLANTEYIEHIPQTRMSDPETTPRESDVPDGGCEDRDVFYGALPTSPTQSYTSDRGRPSDERSGSRRSSASTGKSSPSRFLAERDAHGTLPVTTSATARDDTQYRVDLTKDYSSPEREEIVQHGGRDEQQLFRRTEPEGRSALGDPGLRSRIAARLLEDSAEGTGLGMQALLGRDQMQVAPTRASAEIPRSYAELPPISSARLSSGASFRESTLPGRLTSDVGDLRISVSTGSRQPGGELDSLVDGGPPARVSATFHDGSDSREVAPQAAPSKLSPSEDDASSLAERVRKILEKESPVNHADQIIDEAERTTLRSSRPAREGDAAARASEYAPVTPFSLQTPVTTTDSLPYSPIPSTGYRPIGASHFAKNLISQQLQKMSENRFDQSVELRAQVTGLIDKHLERRSSPDASPRRDSRERTYYQERQDDSLAAADDAVRRAIHDAWTVRDSPPSQPKSVQYAQLSMDTVPQREQREIPIGDEERGVLYGFLPPPSLSSTARTSIQDTQTPPYSSGYVRAGRDVRYTVTSTPASVGGKETGFTFRKTFEDDRKKEEPVKEHGGVDKLPASASPAKPLKPDSERLGKEERDTMYTPPARSWDAAAEPADNRVTFEDEQTGSRSRSRVPPVMRPYKPPGSSELYHIYLPEQDDNVSPGRSGPTTGRSDVTTGRSDTTSGRNTITSGRSETTMESTHSGSDDAFGPYIPPSELGSRRDKAPHHPTGIYGNRTPRKAHVWDVSEDTTLMKSRISEKSTDTDRATESLNTSGEKEANSESLRSKPARSFIEYPSDLRSKTPTEAGERTRSPVASLGSSPVQSQMLSRIAADESRRNARDLVMEEGGPLDIGDLSARPARSFIEYPSDLKSQSAASMPGVQDLAGSPHSRPQSRGMESSKPIPIPARVSPAVRTDKETSLESRERYLHEQPMATSPIRALSSSPVRMPREEERLDIQDMVASSPPARLPPGRSTAVMRSPVRADRPSRDEVRRIYARQQPLTTAFEISKPSREDQGLTDARPVGVGATDYSQKPGEIPSRYVAPEDPYRRPVIGRDYATLPASFTPRDYGQLPAAQGYYARCPPETEYGAIPPPQPHPVTEYASLPNRDYATVPPHRRPAERSFSHLADPAVGDFGKFGDGYTTWPPRGEARHDSRRSGQPLPFGAPQPPAQRYTTQVLQEILEQEDKDAQRLGELWAKFQEMLRARAEDSSESVMSDRIDRLASLIQNPVQHTVRSMAEIPGHTDSASETSSNGSSGTPGRRRKKWQRHEKFEPKQQSEEAEDTHEQQVPRYRYQTQAVRSDESVLTQSSSASTNDSISTERIMNIIGYTQPTAAGQQQRRPQTELDTRRTTAARQDKASIDAARIQAILEAEMAPPHPEDHDTVTDTSMASNMSYETERLYKMLGPRGVKHLGVKLARLQRKIDKQRERHERHQAKRVERQRHYDLQRGIQEESPATSSSASLSSDQGSVDTARLGSSLGRGRVQSSTPQSTALSPVREADLGSVSASSVVTESTVTEETVGRRPRTGKAPSRDDFDVQYGHSDTTTDSFSDASCCRAPDRPKRALSLHDIASRRDKPYDKVRETRTYQKKPMKTKAPEKPAKQYAYFEIDDEGFKKPNKPAPKKTTKKVKVVDELEVPTKDIGTTFPSPNVQQVKKKRGGTAFTVSLGTQTTPKAKADKAQTSTVKRQLKVLQPPKVEKSKIYTPETPDVDSHGNRISPVSPPVAWFQPVSTKQPWQQEPPRKPLKETQTKSEEPKEDKESLQDALEKRKYEFISKSRERVKRIELAAEERKVAAHYERERLRLFEDKHNKKSNPQAHPYSDQLFHPKRRQMSQKEMKKQTEKIYKKLPEVVKKKEEQKRQQAHKTNRLRAQIYKQTGRSSNSNGRGRFSHYSGANEEDT